MPYALISSSESFFKAPSSSSVLGSGAGIISSFFSVQAEQL